MAIREIVWTVSENGQTIHPTAPQDGGVQGEHNATRAVWRVGENSVWETPTFKVYVECEDNAGNVDHTEPLQVVGGQISVLLPQAWTQYGGISTLSLVAEEEDGVVAYLVEGYARFSSRQNASKKVDGLMKGRMAQMEAQMRGAVADATSAAEDAASAAEAAVVAKGGAENAAQSASVSRSGAQYFAEQAAGAAGDATSAAQEAAKLKDEIETKLKNGEFKGEKGDKGDKGDSADIAVDTVYNPESPNAQSGLAVAEALEGVPIKYIESPDADGNIVCLRDLESGVYILTGNFKPYWTSTEILDFHEQPYLANIVRGYHPNSGVNETHMQIYNANNNVLRYYKCTNTAYEVKTIYLNGLASVQSVEEMIAAAEIDAIKGDVYNVKLSLSTTVSTARSAYTLAENATELANEAKSRAANALNYANNVGNAVTNLRIVNVRNYGAVGDGVTDDTESIQAALHYAEDNELPLYIPAGNYLVSKTISTYTSATEEEKAKRSNLLNIFGSGMSTTFTTTDTFDGEYVFNIEVGGAQPRMLWVHDFNLELKADVSGIYFPHIGMKGLVENLWIHHHLKEHAAVRTGIYCDSCTVATFKNIKVFGPFPYTDDSMCAGLTLAGHSTKIIDCDIILCKWGIYLSGGSNWTIDDCRIDENGYGVYQNSSNNILQDDNAYKFTGSFKNLTIKGNRFEHNRKYGIVLVSYGNGYLCNNNVTIANNYFTGLGPEEENGETKYRRAMYFGRCDGVAINENYFNGASEGDNDQNIDIAGSVFNLSLRGNVASLHSDGSKSFAGITSDLTNYSGLINDIEATQSTERATIGVCGNRQQTIKTGGTIDVTYSNVFSVNDGVEVTGLKTSFGDVYYTQEVTLVANGSVTVKNTATLKLNGGVDFAMGMCDTLTLVKLWVDSGTKWVEKSRSVNRAT